MRVAAIPWCNVLTVSMIHAMGCWYVTVGNSKVASENVASNGAMSINLRPVGTRRDLIFEVFIMRNPFNMLRPTELLSRDTARHLQDGRVGASLEAIKYPVCCVAAVCLVRAGASGAGAVPAASTHPAGAVL